MSAPTKSLRTFSPGSQSDEGLFYSFAFSSVGVSPSEPPFALSLVVATRGRIECLVPRLPRWGAAGFGEVIIVDGSYDAGARARVRAVCEEHGARYVPAPVRLVDTRSLSRNLGAREARGAWVLFQDDDDDVPLLIDTEALREAATGKDWLAGPIGEIIVCHRKDAFLAFGGYPEDMVAAEDWIMSNRARAHGVGGREPTWFQGSLSFPPPREDPISRVRNSLWYGYTLLLFLLRCPKRNAVMLGDSRRLAQQLRAAVREPRRWLYVVVGLVARALSPLHCLGVLVRSGPSALAMESYASWGEVRSEGT